MKKIFFLLSLVFTVSINAQDKNLNFTTSDVYIIEFPNTDGFSTLKKKSNWDLWMLDDGTGLISWIDQDNKSYKFYYDEMRVIKGQENKVIIDFIDKVKNHRIRINTNEGRVKVNLMTKHRKTYDGNDAYDQIVVFSNFKIDNIVELLN